MDIHGYHLHPTSSRTMFAVTSEQQKMELSMPPTANNILGVAAVSTMRATFHHRQQQRDSMRSIVTIVLLLCGTERHLSSAFVIPQTTISSSSTTTRTTSSITTPLFATWSDARAVQEYQQFLASGKSELIQESDGPSVIIRPEEDGGSTELADALFRMGMKDDVVLTPGQELPLELEGRTSFPIYMTLPPGPLEQFLQTLPPSYKDRYDDFVFFSGGLVYGNMEDLLKKYGYCRDSMTQVLISGVKFQPRIEDLTVSLGISAGGEEKVAGECAACGKWLGAIAQRLEKNDVRCRVGSYREWRRLMWERSMYDAVFNLLGVVRSEPTTMAEVALYYSEEVSDMVWEISGLLRGWKALTLTYGFEERLFGIAESTGKDQPCTLIDEAYPWIWGNPVYQEGKTFMEYLRFAQEDKGLLPSITLPPPKEERVTIMRQGNLRADGVI